MVNYNKLKLRRSTVTLQTDLDQSCRGDGVSGGEPPWVAWPRRSPTGQGVGSHAAGLGLVRDAHKIWNGFDDVYGFRQLHK